MGYFDSKENVEQYIKMCEGYDGSAIVEALTRFVPDGATVLEIGMGPGTDLALLETRFRATGSDSSAVFVDRYRELQPDADVLVLDAVTLDIDRQFDAVFSNKVLQHLTLDDARRSLAAQHRILAPGGIAFHTLWYGETLEEHHGLRFQQYTRESFEALLEGRFDLIDSGRYAEDAEGDSLRVVLRRLDGPQP